ncbi:hypothetical protein AB6D72_09860 [Vibrio alginolyticus]|uniref:hypothetical protein n=1 Tax=Vibrio alginolyticus TaxID=663 RepID=UPI00354D94B6
MNTIDAATIVFQDVLGFDNPEFASAYVQLSYSDQAELDALWFDLNCDSMKTILMYPDCPKFSEACEYVMELGCDVPSDFRADFTVFFNETIF